MFKGVRLKQIQKKIWNALLLSQMCLIKAKINKFTTFQEKKKKIRTKRSKRTRTR